MYGKGVKKISWRHELSVAKLNEIVSSESYRAVNREKLKGRLIYEGILRMECYKCGYHQKRVIDYKQPLVLSFKDGNKNNWRIENLEMVCYNCYFLYVGNLFTEKQINRLEDSNAPLVKKAEVDFEIDDSFLQHFRDLGLEPKDNGYQDGDEYISRRY